MRTNIPTSVIFVLFLAMGFALTSNAAPVTAGSIAGTFTVGAGIGGGGSRLDQNITSAGTFAGGRTGTGLLGGDTALGQVVVSTTPIPSISATAKLKIPPGSEGAPSVQASVVMKYFFEVLGPVGTVPLFVKAAGGVAISPLVAGNNSDASLTFQFVAPDFSTKILQTVGLLSDELSPNIQVNGVPVAGNSGGFTLTEVVPITTNATYGIVLNFSFDALITGHIPGAEDISAFLDPIIHIDASAVNPEQYTLVLSEGFGSGEVPQVPLPAAVGLVRRRQTCVSATHST
jgi:hypothetical protein